MSIYSGEAQGGFLTSGIVLFCLVVFFLISYLNYKVCDNIREEQRAINYLDLIEINFLRVLLDFAILASLYVYFLTS